MNFENQAYEFLFNLAVSAVATVFASCPYFILLAIEGNPFTPAAFFMLGILFALYLIENCKSAKLAKIGKYNCVSKINQSTYLILKGIMFIILILLIDAFWRYLEVVICHIPVVSSFGDLFIGVMITSKISRLIMEKIFISYMPITETRESMS